MREDKPAAEVRRLVPKPASLISNANCCRSASAPASPRRRRGKRLGRQPGQRPKSDRLTPKVLALVAEGRSYRLIGRELGLRSEHVVEQGDRETLWGGRRGMATSSLYLIDGVPAMPQPNDLSRSLVALDQNSTIIAVIR